MVSLTKLMIIFVGFMISHEHQEAIAAYVPPYTSIVAPITKHTDVANPLYSVEIMTGWVNVQFVHVNFLIDIDAPLNWHNCTVQWNIHPGSCPDSMLCNSEVTCEEHQCTDVRTSYSYQSPSCEPVTNNSILPSGRCSCPINVANPITGSCVQALLDWDEFMVNTSDGRNSFTGIYGGYPNAGCAPSSSFESFPANVSGVMAFSSSPYAYPAYLYDPLKRMLGLCLPSTSSAPGALFFGEGPNYFLPESDVDVRSFLMKTPLLKYPDSFGYFIGVDGIVIKGRSIDIPLNTTARISTIEPYTKLRTNIYKRVVQRFVKVTKRIPRAEPVGPFRVCFRTYTNGSTRTRGLKVPDIDLGLRGGKNWTISTSNSMKRITKDVVCLAFVDGGETSESAIVIGTFQFEDNFLVFDLENSTFGFSSSLLSKQTSCANFNFTSTWSRPYA